MAVQHARIEARLGRAAVRRFANARAVIGADQAIRVEGVLNRTPAAASSGGLVARTRDVTFTCLTAELVVPVTDGTPVTAYHDNQLGQPAGAYKVAPGGRVDDLEAGTTLLELELA